MTKKQTQTTPLIWRVAVQTPGFSEPLVRYGVSVYAATAMMKAIAAMEREGYRNLEVVGVSLIGSCAFGWPLDEPRSRPAKART